jgi:hypothetical protein
VGIVGAIYGGLRWRKLRRGKPAPGNIKWVTLGGVALILVGALLMPTTPEDKADRKAQESTSQSAKQSSKSAASANKNASSKKATEDAISRHFSSGSKAAASSKKAADSAASSLQAKASSIYTDNGSEKEWPLVSRIEVNHSGSMVTGVSIWADGSLANADTATLKHYFALGAQIGNQLLDDDSYDVPYVQVYAEQTKVARSQVTNTSQMKDLR